MRYRQRQHCQHEPTLYDFTPAHYVNLQRKSTFCLSSSPVAFKACFKSRFQQLLTSRSYLAVACFTSRSYLAVAYFTSRSDLAVVCFTSPSYLAVAYSLSRLSARLSSRPCSTRREYGDSRSRIAVAGYETVHF